MARHKKQPGLSGSGRSHSSGSVKVHISSTHHSGTGPKPPKVKMPKPPKAPKPPKPKKVKMKTPRISKRKKAY